MIAAGAGCGPARGGTGRPTWPQGKARGADAQVHACWNPLDAGRQGPYPSAYALIAEPPPDPINEAELSWLWEGMRYPAGSLTTSGGGEVRVAYPGRRAGGAGPDFRDAVVVVEGERLLGDVELHVRASSFAGHGHHADPAYDALVLHVVFLDDAGGAVRLAGGRRVPTAAFGPWVERRQTKVASWLTRTALWQEPCRGAAARLGEEAVDAVLNDAAAARFRARRERLAEAAARDGPDQALWSALLDALAYGGDRAGFARLAAVLHPAALRRLALRLPLSDATARTESALLTVAGLVRGDVCETEAGLPPPVSPPLRAVGPRPANRPERRLAAAARLFLRARGDLPAYAFHSLRGARSAGHLLAAWSVGAAPGQGAALVGRARASEILLNAVLPFTATDRAMTSRALDLAGELPALTPYGKTLFLERNLVRGGGRRRVRSALAQQGLLALHARWCSQGGCGVCPLS